MTLQHSCLLIIATEYAAIYFKNPDLCILWRAHDSLGTDYDMESLLKKKNASIPQDSRWTIFLSF